MILNDATLLSKNIDGVECSTMREFISKLVKAKDLSMKVYVNLKLVCAGPACLNIDNNWIIASINALVSYTDTVTTESIVVKIMQGDVELFESVTPCNAIIPAKDTVATFYVCLASSTPYNELSKRVPHSVFRSRPIAKLTSVDFDKITADLNPSGGIIEPDPGTVAETENTFSIINCYVWKQDNVYTFNVLFGATGPAAVSVSYNLVHNHNPLANRIVKVSLNGDVYTAQINVPDEDIPDIESILTGTNEDILQLNLTIDTNDFSEPHVITKDDMTWNNFCCFC